jgi:hypothetical protein
LSFRRGLLRCAALFALALPASRDAAAQVAAQNLLDVQAGRDPFQTGATDQVDFYDQANLEAMFGEFRLGLRFETNRTSLETAQPSYGEFTLRWAEWQDDRLRVRVGNFYSLIGRGLIHRSFELKGVILDDVSTLSRYTPGRDVDGALVDAAAGPFGATLLSGSPNLGQLAPSAGNARYSGQLNVASGGLRLPRGARVGGTYARFAEEAGTRTELAGAILELDPARLTGFEPVQTPIYLEYAMRQPDAGRFFRFETGDDAPGTALYAAANALWGPLGVSAEWKSYRDFQLGYNDPPSLVREHAFPLLNRNTHVLDANHEDGFQIEATAVLGAFGTLTGNWSRADGFTAAPRRFEERYLELQVGPGAPWQVIAFADDGQDLFPAASISDRTIAGMSGAVTLREVWGVTASVEFLDAQKVNFFGTPTYEVVERYASLGVSRGGWGSMGLQWERTTDPVYGDPDAPDAPNTFVAAVVTTDLTPRHQLRLFAGERRGGPACTAGTCYVVAPFEGVEMRLTSRF